MGRRGGDCCTFAALARANHYVTFPARILARGGDESVPLRWRLWRRPVQTRSALRVGVSSAALGARCWIPRHFPTLKVARTLADLDGSDAVRRIHVAEALSLKRHWAGADQAGFAKVS